MKWSTEKVISGSSMVFLWLPVSSKLSYTFPDAVCREFKAT